MGGLQLPGDLMTSSGIHGHLHTCAQTHINKNNINILKALYVNLHLGHSLLYIYIHELCFFSQFVYCLLVGMFLIMEPGRVKEKPFHHSSLWGSTLGSWEQRIVAGPLT